MQNRIKQWNEDRGLLARGFDLRKESSFILEELIEMLYDIPSIEANEIALDIIDDMPIVHNSVNDKVDAFCDIIVFATGALYKLGIDADKAMDENLKEIEDRTGSIVEGKFIKDIKVKPYKANYNKCKL
jgi:predicted HAD superfamily Cof-like phosphohydrolase